MPIYEFECEEHGEFDQILPMNYHHSQSECPEKGCRKRPRRLPFSRGVHSVVPGAAGSGKDFGSR